MLEVRDLTKQFGAILALDGVSLQFAKGEVHGIVGENGAGKSTLMNLLSGIHSPTSGEILVDGSRTILRSPAAAIDQGIVMIHQELNLVDELSVAENVFLGRESVRGVVLNRKAMVEETAKRLEEVAAPFGPETRVGDLSIAGKQLVEIAKAASYEAKVLIMDEPTAVLSERETTALFALIRRLRDQGVTILFVSHLLPEVISICDRISILRDGQWVGTVSASETDQASLARMMVGRELNEVFPPKVYPPSREGPPLLSVSNLRVTGWVDAFDLDLREGEVVGLAGLVGSGRTEAAEAIVGLRRKAEGKIVLDGQSVKINRLPDAKGIGIAYVSEDRKGAGLTTSMSTGENITLANLRAYANPIISRSREEESVAGWIERLGIRTSQPREAVSTLSGGNQQKVAVAKWLDTKPKVLILDEPTRGIDIGAKREMYALIHELAKEGMACLIISSEMPELIGLCHRVVVLREGRIAGELDAERMSEESIMLLAAGVTA